MAAYALRFIFGQLAMQDARRPAFERGMVTDAATGMKIQGGATARLESCRLE